MERSAIRFLFPLVVVAVSACASLPGSPVRSPALDHVPVVRLPDGHEAVLVRDYGDEQKIDGGERRVRVEYLWDYSAGAARVRTLDLDGRVLEDHTQPGLTLNATPQELEYAFELARSEPSLAAKARGHADVDWYGGFSFREPGHAGCDLGSRCVHVIASRDGGRHKVLHALVDLQRGRVVVAEYDPSMGGIADPSN
jgi:hypothetical protein